MKIDPSQTPLPGLNAAGRAQHTPVKVKDAFVVPAGPATDTLEKPVADTDRLKEAVAKLQAQSNIRPEVVETRKASDPVKAPTDEQLRQFISALRDEI